MGKRWTEVQTQWVRENGQNLRIIEIAKALGFSRDTVTDQIRKNGLLYRKITNNPQEVAFIKENYIQMTRRQLADALGIPMYRVENIIYRHKLSLPEELRKEREKISRFKKGNIPWCAGIKIPNHHNNGNFKKGRLPHNTLTDGVITKRKMSCGNVYYWIRLAQGNWIHLHRKLWQDAYGTIPKGYVIIFKDGNSLNCVLENLQMITRKENSERNRGGQYKLDTDKHYAILLFGRKGWRKMLKAHPELVQLKKLEMQNKRLVKEKKRNETGK